MKKPRFKIKNRMIFGIPLYAEPHMRPGNAPEWFYKWWDRFLNTVMDLVMGLLIVGFVNMIYSLNVLYKEHPGFYFKVMAKEWSRWEESRAAARHDSTYGVLFGRVGSDGGSK